jgi:hypothetical protein
MESHHEKLMAITKAIQKKVEAMMGACLERQRPWIWRQIHKNHSIEGLIWGPVSSNKVPLTAKEMDPGQ